MENGENICPLLDRGCINYDCRWFGHGCPAFPDKDSCIVFNSELEEKRRLQTLRQAEILLLKNDLSNRAYSAFRGNYHDVHIFELYGDHMNLPLDKPIASLSFEELLNARGIGLVIAQEIYKAMHGPYVEGE